MTSESFVLPYRNKMHTTFHRHQRFYIHVCRGLTFNTVVISSIHITTTLKLTYLTATTTHINKHENTYVSSILYSDTPCSIKHSLSSDHSSTNYKKANWIKLIRKHKLLYTQHTLKTTYTHVILQSACINKIVHKDTTYTKNKYNPNYY